MLEFLLVLCVGLPLVALLVGAILSPFLAVSRSIDRARGHTRAPDEVPGWFTFVMCLLMFGLLILLFG